VGNRVSIVGLLAKSTSLLSKRVISYFQSHNFETPCW